MSPMGEFQPNEYFGAKKSGVENIEESPNKEAKKQKYFLVKLKMKDRENFFVPADICMAKNKEEAIDLVNPNGTFEVVGIEEIDEEKFESMKASPKGYSEN